jgi:hypothetical protein
MSPQQATKKVPPIAVHAFLYGNAIIQQVRTTLGHKSHSDQTYIQNFTSISIQIKDKKFRQNSQSQLSNSDIPSFANRILSKRRLTNISCQSKNDMQFNKQAILLDSCACQHIIKSQPTQKLLSLAIANALCGVLLLLFSLRRSYYVSTTFAHMKTVEHILKFSLAHSFLL